MELLEARQMLASDAFLASALIERLDFGLNSIDIAGETDTFQISLDAGQTLSILADPVGELASLVSVFGSGGELLSGVVAAAGQTALAEVVPISASGVYTIAVTGVGGSLGAYKLFGYLNALVEPEAYSANGNNSLPENDSLDASAVSWGVAGVDRLGLIGTIDAAGGGDYFSFKMSDGQFASLALDGNVDGAVLELLDIAGQVLAAGLATQNADQSITRFIDQTDDSLPTEFIVRVTGATAGDEYALVLTRGADFEVESNRNPDLAQTASRILGRVAPIPVSGANLVTDFEGLDSLDNTSGLEPPDTHLAVGPNHVVETVNTAITIYNKDGTVAVGPTQFSDFFSPAIVAGESFLFDPVVAYDELAQRFVVAILSAASGSSAESDLLYAVSNSSDATSGFTEQHRIDFGGVSPGLFVDYPKIGFNADAHVFTFNMFASSYENVDVLVVDKSTVLDSNASTFQSQILERPGTSFTMAAATMHGAGPGDPMWFVEESGYGGTRSNVRVVRLDNVLSATPTFTDFLVSVPSYGSGSLPGADQPDGSKFTTNDARMLNAEFRDGRLVATHSVADGTRTISRWYEFDVASGTPTLTQSGNVNAGPGVSTFYPSIAIGAQGEIGLNYMQSSATEFVSMYVTGQTPGSAPGSLSAPVLVKAGNEVYPGTRGGDYSGISVDPVTGNFWAANEVSLSGAPNPLWSTWICEFLVAPLVDEDWYEVPANAGDLIQISTRTPLDGPFPFENDLDPFIELFAPDGTLIASDDNSQPDGHNALISATASDNGTYRVRTSTAVQSDGVYYLEIIGATGFAPAPTVTAMEPASGSVLNVFPSSIRLNFSEAILVSSVSASDVLVGGLAATSVTILDGDTVELGTDPLAFAGDQTYFVELSGGAIVDLQGDAVDAFVGSFRVDTTGPVLLESYWNGLAFPPDGVFAPGYLSFAGVFNEDLFTISSARRGLRTPGADDVALFESVTGITYAPDFVSYDPFSFEFTAEFTALPEGNYELRLTSGDGAFEDAIGNDFDGEPGVGFAGTPTGNGVPGGDYLVNFVIDVDAQPASTLPFERLQPLGTQIFASLGNSGVLNDAGDVDAFNFGVLPGELVGFQFTPSDPNATLSIDYNGATFTATAPGAPLVVDSLLATSASTQEIMLSGDYATPYVLGLFLNANSAALAEQASPFVLDPWPSSLGSGSVYRAVGAFTGALGGVQFQQRNDASAFVDISGTGTLLSLSDDEEATINTTVGNSIFPAGQVTIGNNGGILAGPERDLTYGNTSLPVIGFPATLLPFWDDIDGTTGGVFWEERAVDGVPALIVQWNNRAHYSGVGSATFQVQLFESGPMLARFAYSDVDFGDATYNSGASATIGVQLDGTQAAQFSFNQPVVANNDVIDITRIVVDVDDFEFDVQSAMVGSPIDILLAGMGVDLAAESLELLGPNGDGVAVGAPGSATVENPAIDQSILDFIPSMAGTYTLRLSSTQTGQYIVAIGSGLALDVGPADSAGAARSLDGYQAAMGYLASSGTPRFIQRNDASAFVDISGTGTLLSLSDDEEATINTTVGNSIFPAGQVTIGNNGGILAGPERDLTYGNTSLPVIGFPATLLPFWDDIDGTTGGVFWEERAVDGVPALIVQWNNRAHYSGVGSATFQVQLFESGPMLARFAYSDVDFGDATYNSGASATIGVQLDGTQAAQFSFNQPVVANNDVIDVFSISSDEYLATLSAGDVVLLQTDTPFDEAPHDPANSIDPSVTVVAPDGRLLAEAHDTAPDGRNARLRFVAPTAGEYRIHVSTSVGGGEYVLDFGLNAALPLAGDFDGDSAVAAPDYTLWKSSFGSVLDLAADGNGDGIVNAADYTVWRDHVGQSSDDFADAAGAATFIGVPSSLHAQINTSADTDTYAFFGTIGLAHRFYVHSDGLASSVLRLLDGDGVTELAVDEDGGEAFIEWTPTTTGPYFLAVEGLAGATGRYQLDATRDDHGNTVALASPLVVPGTARGEIDPAGDVDWFRFSAIASQTYEFQSLPDTLTDVVLHVFAPDGATQVADDIDGGVGFINWSPSVSGDYYLVVSGFGSSAGNYQIRVSQDDHGNNAGTSTAVVAPSSTPGVANFATDVDWFHFAAISGQAYQVQSIPGTLANTVLRLIGSDGTTQLMTDGDGGAGTIAWTAPASGTYYAEVNGVAGNTGSYTFILLVGDDHGDSATFATPIAVPSVSSGTLGTTTDTDWFAFNAVTNTNYRFATTLVTLGDSVLTLYSTNGTTLLADDDDGGPGFASQIDWTAPTSGVYYLRVRGFGGSTGSYQLSISVLSGAATAVESLSPQLGSSDGDVAYTRTGAASLEIRETHTDVIRRDRALLQLLAALSDRSEVVVEDDLHAVLGRAKTDKSKSGEVIAEAFDAVLANNLRFRPIFPGPGMVAFSVAKRSSASS